MESRKRRRIGQRRGKKRRFCAWNEKREERGEETEGERRGPSAEEGVEMFWSCCQPAGGGGSDGIIRKSQQTGEWTSTLGPRIKQRLHAALNWDNNSALLVELRQCDETIDEQIVFCFTKTTRRRKKKNKGEDSILTQQDHKR
jgi:hypothetical protein